MCLRCKLYDTLPAPLLKDGSLVVGFRDTPDFALRIGPLDPFGVTWLPVIAGPNATLRANLPHLLCDAAVLRIAARGPALPGVTHDIRAQ